MKVKIIRTFLDKFDHSVRYQVGECVEFEDSRALNLVERGLVEALEVAEKPAPKKEGVETAEKATEQTEKAEVKESAETQAPAEQTEQAEEQPVKAEAPKRGRKSAK